MTQMPLLLHNLIFHFAPLSRTSHVSNLLRSRRWSPGVALRPQLSPPMAAGLSPLRGLPTAVWHRTGQNKTPARPLVYLRDLSVEDSLVCVVLGRLQVKIIPVVTNGTSIKCQHSPGHSAWVISFHSTLSCQVRVTVLSSKSSKPDVGGLKSGCTTVSSN